MEKFGVMFPITFVDSGLHKLMQLNIQPTSVLSVSYNKISDH